MVHETTHGMHTFVWGSGGAGQLGVGNREDFALPQELIVPRELIRETITTGGCHSAGWSDHGELYVWGDNEKQQLAQSRAVSCLVEPTQSPEVKDWCVVAAACGWSHTVVVAKRVRPATENSLDHTAVLSWGAQEYDQLGRVSSEEHPAHVPCRLELPCLLSKRRIVSLSCGWKHSLLVIDDGSVYSWGSGRHGELGLGRSTMTVPTPTLVSTLSDCMIGKVCCGWQHSVFFSSSTGAVFACGNNRHGQLGVAKANEPARFLPAQVVYVSGEPLRVSQVTVGWHFVLCLSVEGALISWGKGTHGQLGLGSFSTVEVPTSIRFDAPVSSIACGSEHTMVVTQRGELFTCGWGEHGNLGHGDTENRCILTKVQFFQDHNWQVLNAKAGGAVSIVHGCPHSIVMDQNASS